MPDTHEVRITRARRSLEGLSIADALGGFFEGSSPERILSRLDTRLLPTPWRWTDDTLMACSVYHILDQHQGMDQDALAQDFAQRATPRRGYGLGTITLLRRIKSGAEWRTEAPKSFDGGSYGNGAAMRVAPLGAYFADEWSQLVEAAMQSAEVTHAHPEGKAGAVAVALAAAAAHLMRGQTPSRRDFISGFIEHIPESEVRDGVQHAHDLPDGTSSEQAAEALGRGWRVSCQDTVPFTLWVAGELLADYQTAVLETIKVGGDADTTAAIVGGIVALHADTLPEEWAAKREMLPVWAVPPE